ncbi:hypothetical protein Psed_7013 (plasmid) [Pseudonocardia dioxanivorans CB1190]|uniref:Uncharacterized protein n=1 Tax=Pseudonocardia dioxanivorans (strain ATCC 55486 / DSM 44775 / JCM 13855 / CB1190) TaxID=675635 RepID=F2L797_PSEUX|nr:hypothetical protein Psed_7013 [Pseudonocardia dioxanivorans CB1190]
MEAKRAWHAPSEWAYHRDIADRESELWERQCGRQGCDESTGISRMTLCKRRPRGWASSSLIQSPRLLTPRSSLSWTSASVRKFSGTHMHRLPVVAGVGHSPGRMTGRVVRRCLLSATNVASPRKEKRPTGGQDRSGATSGRIPEKNDWQGTNERRTRPGYRIDPAPATATESGRSSAPSVRVAQRGHLPR